MLRLSVLILGLAGSLTASLSSAQSANTNPYTGQPVTLEELSRELETAKAQTAVLEERVKQAQLGMTLNVVPVKEKAELKQLELQVQAKRELEPAPAAAPAVKKSTPKVEKPAPAPAPVVSLSSVIKGEGGRTAILDVNGNSIAVRDGEMTSLGPVAILDDQRVRIGVQTFTVRSFTLSRLTTSDTDPASAAQPQMMLPNMQQLILPPPLPAPAPANQ